MSTLTVPVWYENSGHLVAVAGIGFFSSVPQLLAGIVGKVYPHLDPTSAVAGVGVRGRCPG
jgi:hypothetical protein